MPKAKTTTKKTKPSKPKAHAKTPTRAKARTKPKKHAVKTTHKPKKISKPKKVSKTKAAPNVKKLSKHAGEFNDEQTDTLLACIERIITLRKNKPQGLKSFYGINKILDKYNQRYPHPIEKLNAIVQYGIEKDPSVSHPHFYVVMEGRAKDENDLYAVLAEMGHGKIKFEDAKNKMKKIYEESFNEK